MTEALSPAGVSLDGLAQDPSRVAALAPEAIPLLVAQLAALQSALVARLLTGPNGHPPEEPDRLLTAPEAAAILKVSQDYLYRNARKLPFTVRLGRHLRFSSHGIARYIRQRAGR